MISDMLSSDSCQIPFKTLTGSSSLASRRNSVDWLYSDEDLAPNVRVVSEAVEDTEPSEEEDVSHRKIGKVLIVSLKAGGVGLNLVAANVIYLLDLWWNPATEDQAFQRVHRIGQRKKVRAYKVTVKNSMDSKILELQERKKEIISGALGEGAVTEAMSAKLSLEDLKLLFKPRD